MDEYTKPITTCTEDEDCPCSDCVAARQDFNAWCDSFNQRWAARKAARARTAPSGLLETLAEDGWAYKEVKL